MKLNVKCFGTEMYLDDSLLIATIYLHKNSASDNSLSISLMATGHLPEKSTYCLFILLFADKESFGHSAMKKSFKTSC